MTISPPKDRALELSQRPDIQEWIKQLKQVAETTPKDVWVYVASGLVCVMANDEDGHGYYHKNDGSDQEAVIDSVLPKPGVWDGGDW